MTATVEEAGIYTLVKDALNATDGDDALAFAQWKAWIIEDSDLLNRALSSAWRHYNRKTQWDIRKNVTSMTRDKGASEQPPRAKQRQQSSAFGLVDVARQSTESIYAWVIPYADIDLRNARRSHLAKAEDELVKRINTQTWQCLFVRELRAGLQNEMETVPDRFSESDIEKMMERAHAAVYRRDKSAQAAD